MINEWRQLWSTNTPTSDKFPFGFMQLSTWDANQNTGFPAIRWHQTADHGYVPNEVMEVTIVFYTVEVHFSNFFYRFLNPNIFSNLNSYCSNILVLRNLQEQVRKVFCFKNCLNKLF